ncbi:helix-turn-helix domain-containing protein [Streptomyces luteolus]|uniref:GAF domain-containing protein n=1 Tax=Streptomyces luteolus TaxID=3043615 RepID=A0ABT6T6X4_9ACTN|nr:GAF domain-containing protein [Streptomyces sp. B-S-A12]MDI3423615.1 GAF domain-containing protein [Streptomyces sp. B-S-A12]
MPRSSASAGSDAAWTALRALLDLLAQGAPAEHLARPAAEARAGGATDREVTAIEDATGTALRIRRTLSQHRRREDELTALFDTASDLAALHDLDAVLRAIVHRARLLLRTDLAYLSLNDDTAGDTYMRVTDGSISAAFQQVRLGMGEGLGGLVAQTAHPYVTGDYQDDPRFQHTRPIDSAVVDEGLRAILGVPLRQGTKVIGVLYAADRAPRDFSPEEVALLSSLADHAAIAIDSARMIEETRAALVDLNTASQTIQEHSQALHRAEEAHDRLTELVLRGGDFTEVATEIGALLHGGTLIHDAEGTELARVDTEAQPPPTQAIAASRSSGRAVPLNGTWVCAVLAGPELLGHIVLTGRADLGEADRRIFERAAVVTALLLLLRHSVTEAEDQVRGELLGDLLSASGNPAALSDRARRLHLDLNRPHSVFVTHADPALRQLVHQAARRSARARRGLAGVHHDHVVLLLPSAAPSDCAQDLAKELGHEIGAPVTVGAAGPAGGAAAIARTHTDALRCLSSLRALGHTGVGSALPDLGFVGMLLGQDADLHAYVRRTLGPVLDYDAQRGSDLVHTLQVYFASGMSPTKAREALHVHVNTVIQRLDRIARLLGDDWQAPEHTLELRLALRLHQIVPVRPTG